jgi:hypothetical protein
LECFGTFETAWELAVHLLLCHGDNAVAGVTISSMRRVRAAAATACIEQRRLKSTRQDRG